MKKYTDCLRNTWLMIVLSVGLLFVMPQTRISADEIVEGHEDEPSVLSINQQTGNLPDNSTVSLEPSTPQNPEGSNDLADLDVINSDVDASVSQQQGEQTSGTEISNPQEKQSDDPSSFIAPQGEIPGNSQTDTSIDINTVNTDTVHNNTEVLTPTEGETSGDDEESAVNNAQPETEGIAETETRSKDITNAAAMSVENNSAAPEAKGELQQENLEDKQPETALTSLSSTSVSNEDNNADESDSESRDRTLIEGVTYMSSRVYDYDMPVKFRYSDSYFTSDNSEYNLDLATLSAVAAGTTSGSNRAKGYVFDPEAEGQYKIVEEVGMDERFQNQSKNVQEFLRQIGFSNITVNDAYKKMGTPVSAGVAFGMKNITDSSGKSYTLISVLPRSTSYFGEWANSMEIGNDETDDFAGLESAVREYVLESLQTYLKENEVKGDLKIWTAGLSRGGGIANLTAAYLDDMMTDGHTDSLFGLEGVKLSASDIYAYTFGSPNAASHANALDENGQPKPIYFNIHNFAATYDMVANALQGSWPTTRYGTDGDITVDDEMARDNIRDLLKFYAAVNNKQIGDLTPSDYMYEDEDHNPRFSPIDYTANYQGQEMNLEEFIESYMTGVTETFDRKEFSERFQNGLMFFGETYYGYPTEIRSLLTKDALIDSAKAKGTEVAMEAVIDLFTGDFEALRELMKYVLDPTKILPDIILDTFDSIGMVPKWDLEKRVEFTDEQIESGEAREKNRDYLVTLVKTVWNIGISDPVGFYNLYRSYGTMWASHELDVDLSWLHVMDEDHQEYYLEPVTKGEAWGYRMVTLPDSKDMIVNVYEGFESVDKDAIQAGVVGDKIFHLGSNPDYYLRLNTDSDGHRILFLRADKEYTLCFIPVKTTTTEGMELIEYEFMEYKDIYNPEIILYDDYGEGLGDVTLVYCGTNADGLINDRLLYNIGKIPFEEETENRMRLLRSSASENTEHHAEKYSLSKLIRLGAQASIGGAVSDAVSMLFRSSAREETKTASLTATAAAGYRFLGWYLNGVLISDESTIVKSYSFLSHSELLSARFELIPVPPKPDPKPDPKPQPKPAGGGSGSNPAIVEIAAVTNGVITPAVKTSYRNKTPNTGDNNNAIWLIWMVAGLAAAAGSAYLLKED